MRLASKLGRWAVCGNGKLGKITGWTNGWYFHWLGTDLFGNNWSSQDPTFLSLKQSEALNFMLFERDV